MNLGALRAAVKLRLRLPSNGDPLLGDPTVDACINAALTDISTERDWPWLLTSTTLAFTGAFAPLPADCTKVRELMIGTTPPIRARHAGLVEFLDAEGLSSRYVWNEDQGGRIALTPTPTTTPTATLYYLRSEPILALDATAPLLPAAYHSYLIARASYQCNVRRRYDLDASLDLNEYTTGVGKMKSATSTRTGTRRIQSSFRPNQFATW